MTKKPRPQPKKLSKEQIRAFRKTVYRHYATGARPFLWRNTRDPYKILVSEIMLQQTQAERVSEQYPLFMERFPTVGALGRARLKSVIRQWQGLGYNRRAKMLWEAARAIITEHNGRIPKDAGALQKLPGLGPYTARAVLVFAFNQPHAMIETNIRSVFLHHFFPNKKGVDDARLEPLIGQALDVRNPRKWYSALMDYGAHLKKTVPNPSRASRHHSVQSRFAGSNREIRGNIIKLLLKKRHQTKTQLIRELDADPVRAARILAQMQTEGLLKKQDTRFVIA
ncbi:MAG: A/G-specific adenine glycosylase [Parcubacteria group bacterium]|nr:A/G-specific adenine glycosylase [Parcubacteria group bacterium]